VKAAWRQANGGIKRASNNARGRRRGGSGDGLIILAGGIGKLGFLAFGGSSSAARRKIDGRRCG